MAVLRYADRVQMSCHGQIVIGLLELNGCRSSRLVPSVEDSVTLQEGRNASLSGEKERKQSREAV